jgi:hypothetical protein
MRAISEKIRQRMPSGMPPEQPPLLEREPSTSSAITANTGSVSSLSFASFDSDQGLYILFEKYNLGDFKKVDDLRKGIFAKEIGEITESQKQNMALLDKILEESSEKVKSGYIIADAMDSFVNWVLSQKGGYKGPALGKFLSLIAKAKPKMIKTFSYNSKGNKRKSKRRVRKSYTKKRNFNRRGKRGTKKLYRKRRITRKRKY